MNKVYVVITESVEDFDTLWSNVCGAFSSIDRARQFIGHLYTNSNLHKQIDNRWIIDVERFSKGIPCDYTQLIIEEHELDKDFMKESRR